MDYDDWLTYDPAINGDPDEPEPLDFYDLVDVAYERYIEEEF